MKTKTQKKGQGALEYLMTYGWALLIIVVVGAALFALGVFSPQTREGCTGFAYFQYQDLRYNTTGAASISIINGNNAVTVTGVSWAGTPMSSITPAGAQNAGTKFTVSAIAGPAKTAGSSYSDQVTITYDVSGGIAGKTDVATCTGKTV